LLEQQLRNQRLLLESGEMFQEKLKAGNFQSLNYQDLQQMIINKIHQSEIYILDENISNTSPPGIKLILKADYILISEFLSWELLQKPELLKIRELILRREEGDIVMNFSYELAEKALLSENYLSKLKEDRFYAADESAENLSGALNADLQNILKYRLTEGDNYIPGSNYSYSGSGLPENIMSYHYQQPGTNKTRIAAPSRTGGLDSTPEVINKLPSSISWRGFIAGIEEDFYLFETSEVSLVLSPGDSIIIWEAGQEIEVKLKISENKTYLHHGNMIYFLGEF